MCYLVSSHLSSKKSLIMCDLSISSRLLTTKRSATCCYSSGNNTIKSIVVFMTGSKRIKLCQISTIKPEMQDLIFYLCIPHTIKNISQSYVAQYDLNTDICYSFYLFSVSYSILELYQRAGSHRQCGGPQLLKFQNQRSRQLSMYLLSKLLIQPVPYISHGL